MELFVFNDSQPMRNNSGDDNVTFFKIIQKNSLLRFQKNRDSFGIRFVVHSRYLWIFFLKEHEVGRTPYSYLLFLLNLRHS
jgi:hypothetical protein